MTGKRSAAAIGRAMGFWAGDGGEMNEDGGRMAERRGQRVEVGR
jgi:hypothetical protein